MADMFEHLVMRDEDEIKKENNKMRREMAKHSAGTAYTGVSVAFLIVHPDDIIQHEVMSLGHARYLFSKRGPGCRNEIGKWEFGGGGVEFGETVEDAIKREVREEYGLTTTEICAPILVEQFVEGQHWWCACCIVHVKDPEVTISEPDKVLEPTWIKGKTAFETLDLSVASLNSWEVLMSYGQ